VQRAVSDDLSFPGTSARPSPGRVGWAVLLLALATARGHGTSVDEGHIYGTARSLVQNGSWHLPEPLNDRTLSRYSPLPSLLATPFHALGLAVGDAVRGLLSDAGKGTAAREQVAEVITYMTNGVTTAGTAVFLYHFLLTVYRSTPAAIVGVAGYALCTPALVYAGSLYVQPFLAFFLMATAWALGTNRSWLMALAWLAMVWTRVDSIVLLPCLWVGVAVLNQAGSQRRRARAALCVGTLAGIGLSCGTNVLRGDPWFAGAYAEESFISNPLVGMFGLLASPGKGLVWFSPLAVAGLMVGFPFARRNPVCRFALSCVASYLTLTASWWTWHGGYCWGPRLLLPVMPFCVMPLAAYVREQIQGGTVARLWWLGPVALYSFLVQLVGTGAHPFAEREGYRGLIAPEAEYLFVPSLALLWVEPPFLRDWWWLTLGRSFPSVA
jgi:hypothetical protein